VRCEAELVLNIRQNREFATERQATEFFVAIADGDLATVKRIIQENPNILKWEHPLGTFLHMAARAYRPNLEMAEFFISLGHDVNAARPVDEKFKITPLHTAAESGSIEMLRYLVKKGADVNAGARQHETPLHIAVRHKYPEKVKFLLEQGAKPNLDDGQGQTPLAIAVEMQSDSIASLLRKYGAEMTGLPVLWAKPPRTPGESLDLRKSYGKIMSLLKEAVSNYAAKHRENASKYPAVTAICFVYAIEQNADVSLSLDCRPTYKPDGEFTHFRFVSRDLPEWDQFVDEASEEACDKATVITFDGKTVTFTPETSPEEFAKPFGEMLVDILKTARGAGLFNDLPKGTRCVLGVEELEGNFAWPVYEKQGEDNLV
jgi:ankyrin repeat protein